MKLQAPSLDELMTSWEKDAKVNSTEPSTEILRIPNLHAKYNKWLSLHNLAVKRASIEYSQLRKVKWAYYTGKMDADELSKYGWEPFSFVLKSDISVYIEGDEDLARLQKKKAYHEEAANFCINCMKEISNRTWQLKEYMAWERFIAGS